MDDIGDEDLALHREISAKERIDAILEDRTLTLAQGVKALDAQVKENQGTFPHVVIFTVLVSKSMDDLDTKVPKRSYVGPFVDRRAAEAWARSQWSDNPAVTWVAAKMVTPTMYEDEVSQMRSIHEEGHQPDEERQT